MATEEEDKALAKQLAEHVLPKVGELFDQGATAPRIAAVLMGMSLGLYMEAGATKEQLVEACGKMVEHCFSKKVASKIGQPL